MKKWSIQSRVTVWYTALMFLLVFLVLLFLLSISREVVENDAKKVLISTVEASLEEIDYDDGKIEIDDDLEFLQNTVLLSVYDAEFQMLEGRVPTGALLTEPFEDGVVRKVEEKGESFFLYDRKIAFKKYDGVWIRGLISASGAASAVHSLVQLSFLLLPLLVLLAAAGGYLITRRAFRPVAQIRRTAEEIGDSKDLSRRIHLEGGKDEIYALANTFDDMLERLEQSFLREKQFTSDASHELRTPVTVVLAQCEYTLEEDRKPEEYQAALEVIQRQARRMSVLIAQMLTLARMDRQEEKRCQMEWMNLSELTELVCEEQAALAKEKGIDLSASVCPDCFAWADQEMITRLLINLIENAVKYGRSQGFVRITLYQEDSHLLFAVEDNGIGIAEQDLPHIWDRFYQADDSRQVLGSAHGTGLGLSMVKWIAEQHGGTVTVSSILGKGSRFTFRMPITKPHSQS